MPVLNATQISEITNYTFEELTKISLNEYFELVKPLIFFIIGITIYSIFIFKFYRFIARRDLLKLELHKYSEAYEGFFEKIAKFAFFLLENIIIIPLLVFFWFAVLAILLITLSSSTSPNQILLIAISLVAAIRISAYYNENLAQDLAKLIPFALLAVYIVDTSFFSIENSISIAKQIPSLWKLSFYYLLFVIVLEFALTVLHAITTQFSRTEENI